jgi:hypothetical protein
MDLPLSSSPGTPAVQRLVSFHSSSFVSPIPPSPCGIPVDVSVRRQNITKLLKSSLLLQAIFEIGSEKEDFVDNFYSLLCSVSLQREGVIGNFYISLIFREFLSLFPALALLEIRNTKEEAMLFRTDSACTRLMRLYNANFGHDYLHSIVGTFVGFLQRKYGNVNPSNCQSPDATPEDRERSIHETRMAFEYFLDFLLGTAPHLPLEVLEVAQSIATTVSERFGRRSGNTIVCGYFFLRFLCPCLASPTSFVQIDVAPNVQKFCILLSRILQASVNNQEFENESMHFANEMVRTSQKQIGIFFSCLRKGSFDDDAELIASAFHRIRKDLKKYRQKCPKHDCIPAAVIPEEISFEYFAHFLDSNAFTVRKKIKFESGYARGDDAPSIVTSSLTNFKLLQKLFRHTEATTTSHFSSESSSQSPFPSPLVKTSESILNRFLYSSGSDASISPIPSLSTPFDFGSSPPPSHTPTSLRRKKSLTICRIQNRQERENDFGVTKTTSDANVQLHLKLGNED